MKKIFLKIVIGVVLVCILFVCFLYTNNEIGVTSSKLEADIRSSQPANKKSSPKWDLLQGNLAEGGEKEVQHK